MNKRESIVIATSLASVSIGIMLLIAHNAGIMHIWNTYIWSTFLILLVVTLICVRIYPLNKISNDYKENVKPVPENEYQQHIMRYAAKEALDTATAAEHFGKRLAGVMKDTISLMATCSTGPAFFAVAGIALFMFTPIFAWLGYIFLPFMRIFLSAEEAGTASAGAVLGFVEVTLPSLLVATGDWSLRIRYMLAVVPVTSLIFLASWIPCIMATELPVKFSHLVIIWLMRMFMSIILAGLFAIILFPAGAA
jgi:nucleoside recognition membrane protein YjiH